jgi:hypothetical protein
MSRTDAPPDQVISPFARILSVPLLELYALLWRVGVVEIVKTDQPPHRRHPRRRPESPDPAQEVLVASDRRTHG